MMNNNAEVKVSLKEKCPLLTSLTLNHHNAEMTP